MFRLLPDSHTMRLPEDSMSPHPFAGPPDPIEFSRWVALTLAVVVAFTGCSSNEPGNGDFLPSASASAGATGGASAGGSAATAGGAAGASTGSGGASGGATGAGAAGGATGGTAGSGGTMSGYEPPPPARTETPLSSWRFLRSDASGAEAPGFDDSAWTDVTVPHTWNAQDGQDGGGDYYRGAGWYRTDYDLPAEAAGKRVYLEFDGANIVTEVYVNGTALGQHRGGFARFRFDATDALVSGANVIAARVDNTAPGDVAPLEADFTHFGGLYRAARVLVTNALHIDTEDYASSGVYLDTPSVSAAAAELVARVRVRNDRAEAVTASVETVIVQPDGVVVDTLSAAASLEAGEVAEVEASATLSNPYLWNGRADPYLYRAYAIVRAGEEVTDWVSVPLGFRFFSVDAEQGFFLNGEYLDLHGVNRHQDRLDMGWAITNAEDDEDMALMEEIGANIIRLAHYQQGKYFHDLADANGMVLWEEIPLVNRIATSTAFADNAKQQLVEMIRQGYNHPSILFWGIGNEQRTDDTATNALLDELAALVATEDPYRLSTYAQCCTSDTGDLPTHADIVGYNTYYGWYDEFGTAAEFAAWADGLHAARPTWRIAVSEYGAGGSLVQHDADPSPPEPYGDFHPEEWQNEVHEAHWIAMKSRPYLWSKIIWNMFDFAVDSRDEGDTAGRNDKGLVSYDRQTKKDAFFWYKSNWRVEPLVYVTSRRFTSRTTATVPVKVYSNLDSVELRVNGASAGTATGTDRVFLFEDVPLSAGANEIEAVGTRGAETASDSVSWVRQ
jgi:beta-galactosidase